MYEWLNGKGLDLFISYGRDDWGESSEGRYILGDFFEFTNIEKFMAEGSMTGLKEFLDHATQKEIELPPIQKIFYFGDEAFGWAVDTHEWLRWKARLA